MIVKVSLKKIQSARKWGWPDFLSPSNKASAEYIAVTTLSIYYIYIYT